MQQFNTIAIDDPQDRGQGQELVRPSPVCGQQAKEAGSLGQSRKQRTLVSTQPPIKRTILPSFEGKENAQGDDFARPQVGQGQELFRNIGLGLRYPIEQLADKVLSCLWCPPS